MAANLPPHSRAKKLFSGILIIGLAGFGLSSFTHIGNVPAQPTTAPTIVVPDTDAVTGHALPFKIISAIRNFGFKDGMVDAQVSVSVEDGNPADWMATAIHIAEHSIINGATFSQVEVFVPNSRGDMPPQHAKKLAQAYYSPDPPKSPWPNDNPWTIMTAAKAGSLADIEYDELSNDLSSSDRFASISDPDKRQKAVDNQARKLVVQKYRLPEKWKPADFLSLGLTGETYHRGHVIVVADPDVAASMQALNDCLQSEGGTRIFRGCYPTELRSR